MEVDWSKYRYLQYYSKHSTSYCKDYSVIVDRILSFVPNSKTPVLNGSAHDLAKEPRENNVELKNLSSLETTSGILTNGTSKILTTYDSYCSGTSTSGVGKRTLDGAETERGDDSKDEFRAKIAKYDNDSSDSDPSTESSEFYGSDLIFDMKYCSLQLPIPPEVCQERDFDYTLETNEPPSISQYDVCYDEEVESNYVMAEPFRFLSKVHVTFDKENGEQWCCCYFDARGNYVRKRFNTSIIAFNTAKVLADRCREAAEHTFHNIWILKHKNLLERPIPEKLTESFAEMVNKINNHLNTEDCMVCCVDKIKETLDSTHRKDLN